LAKSSLPALKFKPAFFGHLQENSVWYACTCYHPLFLFNQFSDLERCALRPRIKYDIRLPTASCRNGSAICSNAPLAERVLAQQPATGQKRGTPCRRQERPRPTRANPFHAPGEEWDVTDCPPAIMKSTWITTRSRRTHPRCRTAERCTVPQSGSSYRMIHVSVGGVGSQVVGIVKIHLQQEYQPQQGRHPGMSTATRRLFALA
jgi:hypothetical protein